MINNTLLENLARSLDNITAPEEHLNADELRGLFHAMIISPLIGNRQANWIATFFYGEHPQLTEANINDLNNFTRPIYDAYVTDFKANKLKFPFDLTTADDEIIKSGYDWCRGFFVGLLVNEDFWYGDYGDKLLASYPAFATVRSAAQVFLALANQDFSIFDQTKIAELHAIIRENGQEPTTELMAIVLFISVPTAVNTLQQFSALSMRNQEIATRNATTATEKLKPPRKMQRNEPCFCGSGKKYKKCCG